MVSASGDGEFRPSKGRIGGLFDQETRRRREAATARVVCLTRWFRTFSVLVVRPTPRPETGLSNCARQPGVFCVQEASLPRLPVAIRVPEPAAINWYEAVSSAREKPA